MPLTTFQTEVLRVLAGGRSPESYVAGGTVINAASTAPRFSGDVDVFHDSAFRFFPTEPDPTCGWRLHPLDAATNKILALVGRREPRDYVDAVYLHRTQLSLGALCWAAAGKDGGLTPAMIVELAARNTHYRQEEIDALYLAQPVDAVALKAQWLAALEEARDLVVRLPAAEVGCLYVDADGQVVTPTFGTDGLLAHFGCVGGAWPMRGRTG